METSDPLTDLQFPLTSPTWPVNQDPLQQLMTASPQLITSLPLAVTSPRAERPTPLRRVRNQSHPGAVREEEEEDEEEEEVFDEEKSGSGRRVRTISQRRNSQVLGSRYLPSLQRGHFISAS